METKTIAFKSLGCKLNQYEIQALREGFLRNGFLEVPLSEAADYYVLNTCTVTEGADSDARGLIGSFHRLNPNAQIIVTGCYATAHPQEVAELPGVTFVTDNKAKNQILFQVLGTEAVSEEESPFFREGISYFEDKSRAFVKVQDGCNYFCTFCKIPYVRGRLVSRPEEPILNEVRRLVERGYEEIVLSGVCLGSYGKDLGRGRALTDLLKKIIDLPGRFRIRLSSIDPRDTPLDIADLMRATPKLCAHLHLSLQSGDDAVLGRMKRGYTARQFEELVFAIRERVPGIGFSTDVIVGFPGEDDAMFENTAEFLRRIAFHKVHIFPYSERPATKAVHLEGKVRPDVVRARSRRLAQALKGVTENFMKSLEGATLEVLAESRRSDGLYEGFSQNYARCVFPGGDSLKGRLSRVRGVAAAADKLMAEVLP